jgi:hypothetical protein
MAASEPVGQPTSPCTSGWSCHTSPKPRTGNVVQAEAVAPAAGVGDPAAARADVAAGAGCDGAVVVAVGTDEADVAVTTGVGAAVGVVGMVVGVSGATEAGTAETTAVAVAGALALCTLQPASKPATTTNPPIAAVVLRHQLVSTAT